MTYIAVYNTTQYPVQTTSRGNFLGGHEWGVVDDSEQVVQAAIENEEFIVVPLIAEENYINSRPEAVAVSEELRAMQDKE